VGQSVEDRTLAKGRVPFASYIAEEQVRAKREWLKR